MLSNARWGGTAIFYGMTPWPASGSRAFPQSGRSMSPNIARVVRSRRANIGEHGRLTPEEARSLAKKLLGVVESGGDPIEARREARAVRTFGEVAEDFMRQHVAAKRKSRTEASYREVLEKHVYPAIKSRRIIEVRPLARPPEGTPKRTEYGELRLRALRSPENDDVFGGAAPRSHHCSVWL
jgi:hypothetical protein